MKTALRRHGVVVLVIVLLATALLGINSYYWYYHSHPQTSATKTAAAHESTQALVASVAKLMVVPADEQPTLATVTDVSRLREQPFFQKAQNGDKVLIYRKANMAILYRPAINKIITVAPISSGMPAGTPATTETGIRIAFANGTTNSALLQQAEEKVTATISTSHIMSSANAKRQDYMQTLVVPLSAGQASISAQIAEVLHGQVIEEVPASEVRPANADILVIIGKDH